MPSVTLPGMEKPSGKVAVAVVSSSTWEKEVNIEINGCVFGFLANDLIDAICLCNSARAARVIEPSLERGPEQNPNKFRSHA